MSGTAESGPAEILDRWFQMAVDIVDALVGKHEGAMRIRPDDLRTACEMVDVRLKSCPYPQTIWNHITCESKLRAGLESIRYFEGDGTVVIFNPKVLATPEDAQLYSGLLDMSTVAVG